MKDDEPPSATTSAAEGASLVVATMQFALLHAPYGTIGCVSLYSVLDSRNEIPLGPHETLEYD